jgi:mRNA interferase RelE/StbE
MPSYKIEFTSGAGRVYDKLFRAQPAVARRILAAIEFLHASPYLGKKLTGKLKDCRALRVGEYRVIYTVLERLILIQIIDIGHRREIYR